MMRATSKSRLTGDTRLIDLTVNDVREIVADVVREELAASAPAGNQAEGTDKDRYVHGIAGIARLFGVARSTANRIKQSGVIDEAISQCGRSIVTDTVRAIELTRGTALGARAESHRAQADALRNKYPAQAAPQAV